MCFGIYNLVYPSQNTTKFTLLTLFYNKKTQGPHATEVMKAELAFNSKSKLKSKT